jgi:hypothetical protein
MGDLLSRRGSCGAHRQQTRASGRALSDIADKRGEVVTGRSGGAAARATVGPESARPPT